jgi:hypothetical protein
MLKCLIKKIYTKKKAGGRMAVSGPLCILRLFVEVECSEVPGHIFLGIEAAFLEGEVHESMGCSKQRSLCSRIIGSRPCPPESDIGGLRQKVHFPEYTSTGRV